MRTTAAETVPASWDDARDIPFFRITAHLFTPAFCLGATALLASYDDQAPDTAQHRLARAHAEQTADKSARTTVGTRIAPGRDPIPGRVRRPR